PRYQCRYPRDVGRRTLVGAPKRVNVFLSRTPLFFSGLFGLELGARRAKTCGRGRLNEAKARHRNSSGQERCSAERKQRDFHRGSPTEDALEKIREVRGVCSPAPRPP